MHPYLCGYGLGAQAVIVMRIISRFAVASKNNNNKKKKVVPGKQTTKKKGFKSIEKFRNPNVILASFSKFGVATHMSMTSIVVLVLISARWLFFNPNQNLDG
jgi:hypothetical protein